MNESRKPEYFWASSLIINYQGTIDNPDFQALDKEIKDKAIQLFQEQKLIHCERCQ